MSESSPSSPSCPSCQSVSVVKNGSTRHGKTKL
ncbi:transposase-like zinc-binding domain-containing protein [Pseudanabaena catenata]